VFFCGKIWGKPWIRSIKLRKIEGVQILCVKTVFFSTSFPQFKGMLTIHYSLIPNVFHIFHRPYYYCFKNSFFKRVIFLDRSIENFE